MTLVTSSIFEKGNFVIVLSFSYSPHLVMMDRPNSSANPLFEEQGDDFGFVSKNHFFIAQRALHQESEALGERMEQLASDLRQSETRNRDYIDEKFTTQMEELSNMIMRRPSSSSSSTRRRHSSRRSSRQSSDYSSYDASPP